MATHWKKMTNPDYMGSWSFDGKGNEIVATIDKVSQGEVIGENSKKDIRPIIYFKERHLKPLVLNATNGKTLTKLFKTPYIEEWKNRTITLYVASVKAFGTMTDAVRIQNEIPRVEQKTTSCADCNKDITGFNGKSPEYMANYTQTKYGKPLCADCAKQASIDKVEQDKKAVDLSNALAGDSDE